MTDRTCPSCGEAVEPMDRFCESCGWERPGPRVVVEIPEPRAEAVLETSSRRARPSRPCAGCGAAGVAAGGHCDACGLRRPVGDDHVEIELAGPGDGRVRAAGAGDLGLRRARNEDALALAALPHAICAVVCDGVASAPGSDEAAQVAADTGAVSLARSLASGAGPERATRHALAEAGAAVTALAASTSEAPACTYVSAVVTPDGITVGWIGDSRAYWIASTELARNGPGPSDAVPGRSRAEPPGRTVPDGGWTVRDLRRSAVLTRDDSWAEQMIARRALDAGEARGDPRAHLLTGWLGADADPRDPRSVTFRPAGPGWVVVCSDGLWNHLPEPSAIRDTVKGDEPLDVARGLVRAALEAGGHDNVTVAVVPFPPRPVREAPHE